MERWLSKHNYICGDEVTIADLSACQELVQLRASSYDYGKYPNLEGWLKRLVDDDPQMTKLSKPLDIIFSKIRAKVRAKL